MKSALAHAAEECLDDLDRKVQARIAERILCPSSEAVALTMKPGIRGAVAMGCFQTSPCLVIDPLQPIEKIFEESMQYCDETGYPVMVKGSVTGARQCNDWTSTMLAITAFVDSLQRNAQSGEVFFIQKLLHGSQKTIAFAAYKGQLTGCMQMTKVIINAGKVWSGLIEPVSPVVIASLERFVAETSWTGGGELEFIETIDQTLTAAPAMDKPSSHWYIIDFNTRFPAWIYAGALKDKNLPGDLIHHALLCNSSKERCDWSFEHYLGFEPFLFTRSVVEQLAANINMGAMLHSTESASYMVKGGCQPANDAVRCEPQGSQAQNRSLTDNVNAAARSEWMTALIAEADSLVKRRFIGDREDSLCTPHYLLSTTLVGSALSAFNNLMLGATGRMANVKVELCLSVKTQPHHIVLRCAEKHGYLAECISLAEVYAALEAGYWPGSIVLTGPGKFWEGYVKPTSLAVKQAKSLGLRLGVIFADSLADLITIMHRINDPGDFLKANVIGIRFQPLGISSQSRFGIDSSDNVLLEKLAEFIKENLPVGIALGVHFHYASSSPQTGLPKWFAMARSMLHLSLQFAELCGRRLAVLDFGGGFLPHILRSPAFAEGLRKLLRECSMQYAAAQALESDSSCLIVQFELGKCITQNAGGLLCKVLEVREIVLATSSAHCSIDAKLPGGGLPCVRRALIVDASIGEVFIPHLHPIYYCPAERIGRGQWQPLLNLGQDEIWGKSCMEFDVQVGASSGWGGTIGSCGMGTLGITIPADLKTGDYLLIGATGAYDMSMSYAFADGQGRSQCVTMSSSGSDP